MQSSMKVKAKTATNQEHVWVNSDKVRRQNSDRIYVMLDPTP